MPAAPFTAYFAGGASEDGEEEGEREGVGGGSGLGFALRSPEGGNTRERNRCYYSSLNPFSFVIKISLPDCAKPLHLKIKALGCSFHGKAIESSELEQLL
jgi:hypothetical protein